MYYACSRVTKQPWFNHYNAFSNITCLTRMSLSTWQQIMTTFIQPPQCDLQRGIPKPHRTTHVTRRHAKCRTPRENHKTSKRTYPQPPHTRAALHHRLQPLYTEKHKVSCSGFLPNTSPMHHSCSHSNAICNQGFHNRIELRRHEDTQSAEHQGRTQKHQNERTRNRLTHELPFTAACSHFTRKNTRSSSPTQAPCNIHAAITMPLSWNVPY